MEAINFILGLIGALGTIIAVCTLVLTEKYKNNVRTHLNLAQNDSQEFLNQLEKSDAPEYLKENYRRLNHSITIHLLKIDKKLAIQWVKLHIQRDRWREWELNLQINKIK